MVQMFQRYVKNHQFFTLITDPRWKVVTLNIKKAKVKQFEKAVLDNKLSKKVVEILALLESLSAIIHHSKLQTCQVSWILPLYWLFGYKIVDWLVGST